MKKILVLTNEFDIHCDAVTKIIREQGGDIIRINSQHYDANVIFEINNCSNHVLEFSFFISDSNIFFSSNSYDTIWYRKPLPIEIESAEGYDKITKFRTIEYQVFIREFYNLNKTKRWINDLDANEQASYKLSNLDIAKNLGLKVPKTIVTNNPTSAEEFAKFCNWNIIVKPFKAVGASLKNIHFSAYANRVNEDEFYKFKQPQDYLQLFYSSILRKS